MLQEHYQAALRAAAADLARAQRVLVMTGAGISAASGLPVYRGLGGLYDGEATEDGCTIEEALSGRMLRRAPEVTWKYLLQIARACAGKAPNAAHAALVAMEQSRRFASFTVLTQNVDGFHARAGSRSLIEIHGDLARLNCSTCGYSEAMPATVEAVPACPCCGHSMRPSIVLFGEALPTEAITRLEAVLDEGVDFVMSVGTSAGFPYIAGPFAEAARAGLPTLEINPQRTEISHLARHRLQACAATALPDLWNLINPLRSSAPLPVF